MIRLYKPKEIKLDTCGMGRGVKDALDAELHKSKITCGDKGFLVYGDKEKEDKLTEHKWDLTSCKNIRDILNNQWDTVKAIPCGNSKSIVINVTIDFVSADKIEKFITEAIKRMGQKLN